MCGIKMKNLIQPILLLLIYEISFPHPSYSQNQDSITSQKQFSTTDSFPFPSNISYLMLDDKHIIYENGMVFYGYDFKTHTAENSYQQSMKLTRQLFRRIKKTKLEKIINVDCMALSEKERPYCSTLEWNNKGKKIRVIWFPGNNDDDTITLIRISDNMGRFW
ncbi:MAG: hypothetical protein A3H98_11320 [Bacteroidetes bacterium RIFCSPLOWO2_02_FULL_36_8]|nr:MAG: hypothetical protein A3H98_11320 [Bacteroidetes bacterium RIFCSPLOWO2_02_FULL_36_8]OFY69109.1 MAG: hypothetical protein A3G23_06050 [Bacteroidetes bacterium RIFCSPLOWO2_12_FULL_37_12]